MRTNKCPRQEWAAALRVHMQTPWAMCTCLPPGQLTFAAQVAEAAQPTRWSTWSPRSTDVSQGGQLVLGPVCFSNCRAGAHAYKRLLLSCTNVCIHPSIGPYFYHQLISTCSTEGHNTCMQDTSEHQQASHVNKASA